jgi:hypothetical protein
MKVAFLFPTDGEFDPRLAGFFSDSFFASFSELGVKLLLVKSDGHDGPSAAACQEQRNRQPASTITRYFANVQSTILSPSPRRLQALLQEFSPDVVQTFGYASRLSAVWAALGKNPYPIVHFVTSGGPPVQGDNPSHASARITPPLNSFAGRSARRMSRHVSALIGSNRCDLAYHRDSGFFRIARFSIVAGLPVANVAKQSTASKDRSSAPRFGVFSFDDAIVAAEFLLSAAGATGVVRPYNIVLSDRCRSIVDRWSSIDVELTPTHNLDEFLQAVDIVVIPYPDDASASVIARAAAAGKTIVASEGGLAGELLDYGRRGFLFRSGSETDLAFKMQDIIAAWPHGSPLFTSAEEILVESSPRRCAEKFLSAYLRLSSDSISSHVGRRKLG